MGGLRSQATLSKAAAINVCPHFVRCLNNCAFGVFGPSAFSRHRAPRHTALPRGRTPAHAPAPSPPFRRQVWALSFWAACILLVLLIGTLVLCLQLGDTWPEFSTFGNGLVTVFMVTFGRRLPGSSVSHSNGLRYSPASDVLRAPLRTALSSGGKDWWWRAMYDHQYDAGAVFVVVLVFWGAVLFGLFVFFKLLLASMIQRYTADKERCAGRVYSARPGRDAPPPPPGPPRSPSGIGTIKLERYRED